MSPAAHQPSKEDVLDAFAVERDWGRETLERYLRAYPQFAAELIDLSRELAREIPDSDTTLSTADQAIIDTAWQHHAKPAAADPLARLSTQELRNVAKRLDVPRQVITAFRERRVILSTVPRSFLACFAEAVNSSIELLVETLSSQSSSGLARSYKADGKPGGEEAVSFERVLTDAGVPDERRVRLMSDAN